MGRFYGEVGYAESTTVDDVTTNQITVKNYYGDLKKVNRRLKSSEGFVDDMGTSTVISIVADPYAYMNFMKIVYVVWQGVKWKAATIDATTRPRIHITLGEVFNE